MKKMLIVIERAPYGTSLPAEAFRMAIGLAGMEDEVSVLLAQDGVFAALADQRPDALGMKSIGEALDGLGEFGVRLYALDRSLEERGLDRDRLIPNVEVVGPDACRRLIEQADGVVGF